jgi:2-oxoglutarate ferredoxin oxidoreductase subunit gamma
MARELGRELVANVIALGAVGQLCPAVEAEGLQQAVLGRVPPKTIELNTKAFAAGAEAAAAFDLSTLPRSITPDEEQEI